MGDFKPVREVEDFKPSIEVTPEMEAARKVSSGVTAHPSVPIFEGEARPFNERAATATRYGLPAAAGFLMPGLSLPVILSQGLVAGGSEIAARKMERASSDPELDTMWSDLKAGGAVGLLDVAASGVFRGGGQALRFLKNKIFIPAEIPLEVRTAQEVLGRLTPEEAKRSPVRNFMRWLQQSGSKRPFSLTYGQINAEEKNFITWLEGIARAGIGSRGAMKKFDLRNENMITDLIGEYVKNRSTQLSGPEFAVFAKRLIGDMSPASPGKGEMFIPVEAYRKYLYTQFEDKLASSGMTVDGSALRQYLIKNPEVLDGLPRKLYSHLRASGLVPPLEAASQTKRSFTRTTTEQLSGGQTAQIRQSQVNDVLAGGAPTSRRFDASKTLDLTKKEGTVVTARETESLIGQTEEELRQEWANLPATDANQIVKMVNSFWKDGDDPLNKTLAHIAKKIDEPFQDVISAYRDPESKRRVLKELHDTADDYFKKEVNFMRNGAIRGLRKTLSESPAKVMSLLGGGTNEQSARGVYDRLIYLKDALGFSAETQHQIARETLEKPLGSVSIPQGAEAMQKLYEKTILRPLRYNMIMRHVDRYGNFNPTSFLDSMNKNADVPEFFEEVFGGAEQVERVKELMTTLAVLQQPSREQNVVIQLMQAGAIGGALSAAGTAILSDDVDIKETGKSAAIGAGVGILLGPYALARMLTDAPTIRMFTDGLKQGYHSGRFGMALRKMAEMKIASELFRDAPTSDMIDYYTNRKPAGERP